MPLRKLTVKKDGTGDFTTVADAVASVSDASADSPCEIIIHPGVYAETGIRMKHHVSLCGTDRDACEIRGELPPESTDKLITRTSTIDWNTSGHLKDLTITCRNMRYPVHSDGGAYGNKDGSQEIANCRLEHHGNADVAAYRAANGLPPGDLWGSLHAWGCGTSDGMSVTARDSVFVSPTTAFYFHENMNFEKPSYVSLQNCRMIATNDDGAAICVQGYASGRNGKIIVNHCEIVGFTDITVGSYLPEDLAARYFRQAECTFAGGGNTLSPVRIFTSIFALRITSQKCWPVSSVRVGGKAAAALFGDPVCNDGLGGLLGYAEGTTDISDTNPNTPATGLGMRLGDRRSEPWTLEVLLDGSVTKTVTFDADHTAMSNGEVMDIIARELGGDAKVSEAGAGYDYYPEYSDQSLHLFNKTSDGILKGMAVTYDMTFKNCRVMKSTDPADAFVGVAMEDIKPGGMGLILRKGIVFDSPGGKAFGNGRHGILQHTYSGARMGDRFGISAAEQGCFEKDAKPEVARGVGPGLIIFDADKT